MNEFDTEIIFFSLLIRVVEILDVVGLWDNSLRVSLSNQCETVYVYGSIGLDWCVCVCKRW